ncbi:MAG: hypothetical protein ACOYBY_13795 [Dermatophilaceae bacterium]
MSPSQATRGPDVNGNRVTTDVTAGSLRRLIEHLPADVPVVVGVRHGHHFNCLVGELAVVHAAVFAGSKRPNVVLDVDGLS